MDVTTNIYTNAKSGTNVQRTVTDATVDTVSGVGALMLSGKVGAEAGSAFGPGIGTAIGFGVGIFCTVVTDVISVNEKSLKEHAKDTVDYTVNNAKQTGIHYIKNNPKKVEKVIKIYKATQFIPIPILFN